MMNKPPPAQFNLMQHGFYARVVDVASDPEKAGRAKIRILGMQDDTTKIPDSDLFWARPIYPITNPAVGGAAGQQTGLKVGSTVVGFWADEHQQIPVIWGTTGASGVLKEDGTLDQSTGHSVPLVAREVDKNDVLQTNIVEKATTGTKYVEQKTVGGIKSEGQKLLDVIKSVDPTNVSGALGSAILGVKGVMSTLSNITSFQSLITGIANNKDLLATVDAVQDLAKKSEMISQEIVQSAQGVAANVADGSVDPRVIVKDATTTTQVGSALMSFVEDMSGVEEQATQLLTKALGGSVGPLIGTMKNITGASGSYNFAMNNTMGNVNSAWSLIKSQAAKAVKQEIKKVTS